MLQKETILNLKSWFAPHSDNRLGGASLDILRFAASIFILLFHYYLNIPQHIMAIDPIMSKGWIGTDFFIMLSGLVLARAYGQSLSNGVFKIKDFMIRRYARLMPSHLIILYAFAFMIIISGFLGFSANNEASFSKQGFALQALLMNGWGIFDMPSWNYPTWTISALIICYFLYAILVKYIYNLPKRDLLLLFVAIILGINQVSTLLIGQSFVSLTLKWALVRAVPLFFLGVIIERLFAQINISKNEFKVAILTILSLIFVCAFASKNMIFENLIIILLALLLGISSRVTLNESKATKRAGRISYSLYLIHVPFQIFYFRITKILVEKYNLNNSIEWIIWFGAIAMAIIIAFIFELFIDYPVSNLLTKRLKESNKTNSKKGDISWRKLHI